MKVRARLKEAVEGDQEMERTRSRSWLAIKSVMRLIGELMDVAGGERRWEEVIAGRK